MAPHASWKSATNRSIARDSTYQAAQTYPQGREEGRRDQAGRVKGDQEARGERAEAHQEAVREQTERTRQGRPCAGEVMDRRRDQHSERLKLHWQGVIGTGKTWDTKWKINSCLEIRVFRGNRCTFATIPREGSIPSFLGLSATQLKAAYASENEHV